MFLLMKLLPGNFQKEAMKEIPTLWEFFATKTPFAVFSISMPSLNLIKAQDVISLKKKLATWRDV